MTTFQPAKVSTPFAQSLARFKAAEALSRAQHVARAGLTFENTAGVAQRDLYSALGYKRTLTYKDYLDRYQRNGIAERVVEAYPRATWSGGARVVEDPSVEVTTPFEAQVEELFTRLDVWQRLTRADILAGIGRYAVLLIGAPGDPSTPLPRLSGPDDILYFTPLSEDQAKIGSLVTDVFDPRFNLPLTYDVHTSTEIDGQSRAVARTVHWSRCIHISEGNLTSDIYGKPRLRAIWNYLDDLDKIVGGGSEAAWKNMWPGMQIDLDPEGEFDQNELDELEEELDLHEHGLRRYFKTQGATIKTFEVDVATFKENADAIVQLISATSGIPHRIFTGSERGELASVQDRNNWNDRNAERRRDMAGPVTRTLLQRLIDHGALVTPKQFELQWSEIDELDPASLAELLSRVAEANKFNVASGDLPILDSAEIRSIYLNMPPMTDEQIAKLDARTPAETSIGKVVDQNDPDSGEQADDNNLEVPDANRPQRA